MTSITPRDDLSSDTRRSFVRSRVIMLVVLLAVVLGGALISTAADRGFADVEVSNLKVMTSQNVPLTVKVYRPAAATAENPAPGILALHGYQSEKEATSMFGATELARRGFVVVAFDHFGHGDSTDLGVSPEIYSGAGDALETMKALDFVHPDAIGIFGHSTGSIYAVALADADPDIGAIVALSGNGSDPAIPGLRNYLLVQGSAEEIPPYREGILLLIQFVPLFTVSSPGMDLIGLPQFGGRWSMMLWVIIPQFITLIAISTWAQVRSRSFWIGTLLGAMLFTWFVVGAQVGRF